MSAGVPDEVVGEVVVDVHHVRGDIVKTDQVWRYTTVLTLLSSLQPPAQPQVAHQVPLKLEREERGLATDFTLDEFYGE